MTERRGATAADVRHDWRRGCDWPLLPAGLALASAWLVFAWPWLSGAVTVPWDAKAHFLPQVQFLAASIARGESPFWTPNVFAGMPQIADPQSLMFSPPMVLLALVNAAPGLRAIDSAVLLTVLAGGAGVLLLARELGWHWAGALIAALGFMFGAAMAWRLQHFGQVMSLAYLPFALLFLKRALARPSWRYGLAAGVAAALIVLGRDQVGLLCIYLLAGYVVWFWLTAPALAPVLRSSVTPLAGGAIVGLVLTAIPIILTALLAAQSNRPAIDYAGAGAGSLHPAQLVTAVIPHIFGAARRMEDYWGPPSFAWRGTGLFTAQNVGQLYIGAVPALLLVAGAMRGILWSPGIRFVTVALIASLLYALGWYTPVFRVLYELAPGVALFRRPADAVFLIGAMAALLAGYVAHRAFTDGLPAPKPWQRAAEIATLAAVFALSIGFALWLDRLDRALAPALAAAAWLGAGALALRGAITLKATTPAAAGALLIGFTALDLAWNNGPNGATALPPAEVDMLEPTTRNATVALLKQSVRATRSATRRDRVELAGLGFHWPNASLTHDLDNTLGYNPVRLSLYTAATGAGDTVGLPDQRKFTALFPSYRSPLADLLGLRFIATGVPIDNIDAKLGPGDLTLLARTPDGYIYENPRAYPRVLFAHAAQEADFAQVVATGGWPISDFASTVLLERPPAARSRRPGSVRLISYRNTEIVIESDSLDGGWVVLNDVWHPWWFAEVDSRRQPLLRANVLFRAVEVAGGKQVVRLSFRPLAGAWAELLGRGRPR